MILKKRTEERLGEILLRLGVITQAQIEQALELQKEKGGLLGEMLIELGHVEARDISEAIISQYGIPFLTVENYDPNPKAVSMIDGQTAKKYKIIPLDVGRDIITIGMVNPLDKNAIDQIEQITGKKVQVFIVLLDAAMEKINSIY